MKVDQAKFLECARELNLNSVVGDGFEVNFMAPFSPSIVKNRDQQLASLSALPADRVTLDMAFGSYDEARIWCANNIRACAINADFMHGLD